MRPVTCIRAVRYAFPAASRSVRELAASGLVRSEPGVLEGFGFDRVRTAVHETPFDMALTAARSLLDDTGIAPESVDLLVHGGAPGAAAFARAPRPMDAARTQRTAARFRYPGTRLQYELGLETAQVVGIDQLACTTLFGAVRIARALCLAEGMRRALCVVSDFFPVDAGREAVFNCTSDAAVAVLVERGGERNRIVSASQVTKGFYWDPDALQHEMVAAYFPTSRHVLARTAETAGWGLDEVDWVIPHNVGRRSWRILASLAGLGHARIWLDNVARDGHTLAGDNFINLADALDSGEVRPGDKMLLFSFGYGAHWTGLAVEA
jgi:3-oxoacyl-[acyl-carrier-protein] synthase-3